MKTITITSQGQITIPAKVRRSLGLKELDELSISYDQKAGEIRLKKAMTLDEITIFSMSKIDKNAKPVEDVNEYYSRNRTL